ncbi:MAG: adenosylcobinamide-GDP ribazoletransferase [Flexilinea sp.]|nr:adenosylcobinamide-GDP ribazoletransferase [Flexilinea sp.]
MTDRPDYLNAARMAFGFLTVLSVPQKKEWSDTDFGRSALFYPLTGALIGLGAAGSFRLLSAVFERPVAAFLTLIVWILLSGGLHWDGLADCFDGFGCSADPKRRLEIMKDPRLGTYGALGIFCSLILKWLCLWNLPDGRNILILFPLFGASARWAMLFLLRRTLANPNGLAAMLKNHCPKRIAFYAAPLPLLLAAAYGKTGFLFLILNLVLTELLGLTAQKKIGGINGDVLGFSIELAEIVLLLSALVIP